MVRDAAGHDAAKMAEIRLYIDADAVEADPFAQSDSNGGDLVFGGAAIGLGGFLGPLHPNPDATGADFAAQVELIQCGNDPIFELAHETAHVAPAGGDVEHHIGDTLARPVIGVLPAAPGGVDGEAVGLCQVFGPRRGAGGVERGCSTSQMHSSASPAAMAVARASIHASALR